MAANTLLEKVLCRAIIDPCVRTGLVPYSGWAGDWFGRLARGRVIRPSKSHPISEILSHDEWKTGFSISDHTLLWLWRFLAKRRPKAILELGSGMSTLVFAKYIELWPDEKKPRLISVDHDGAWLGATHARANELRLQSHIRFQETGVYPLKCENSAFQGRATYDLDLDFVKNYLGSPDLILIDGPPSAIGRSATFPSLLSVLQGTTSVLIDDASRAQEATMMAEWMRFIPGLVHIATYPIGNGLGHLEYACGGEH